MSTNGINITIDHISKAASVASDEDGSHGAALHASPPYSVKEAHSQSGSSDHHEHHEHHEHRELPPDLDWPPDDSPDHEEIHRAEFAPDAPLHRHHTYDTSRSSSLRRPSRRHTTQVRDHSSSHRRRNPPASPPPESVDSAEEYWREGTRAGPPQRQSYYGHGPGPMLAAPVVGYAPSSSSGGSYGHGHYPPMGAQPGHMVPYAGAILNPAPYSQQYPNMQVPVSLGYAPSHQSYPHPHPISHHNSSQISSPYTSSPYMGTPTMTPYAPPPAGYFPPQYPQAYATQPYIEWRMQQAPPPAPQPAPAPAAPAPAPAPAAAPTPAPSAPAIDQEELVKRVEAMLLKEKEEREARDASVDQEELVKRVEAMLLKEKEERQARDDAREAQLKAEAAAAEAKAERAASDAKIAEEAASKAAAAAKAEAEKNAAAEAEKAAKEAEAKLKEKEELLEKAKKEAEEAAAKAAEASKEVEETKKLIAPPPPPEEKKAPVRFHDAIGRKFNFPFHLCTKWTSMEELIRQAFEHVEEIGPHVHSGHYDLMGPDSGIIVPSAWDTTIEPDMKITMHMWPLPEPKEEPLPPPPPPPLDDGGILNLDDLLGPEKEPKPKPVPKAPKKTGRPSAFGSWMLGSSKPRGKPALKGDKKPDVAAGYQHVAGHDQNACSVM